MGKGLGKVARVTGIAAIGCIVLAGIAYATIPDSAGSIHGCFNPTGATKNGGTALNVVDSAASSCGKGQQEIVWNQTGPPGPKGDKGDRGDKGDPGDAGAGAVLHTLSHAYPDYEPDHITTTAQAVASLAVPAGTYLVLGDVVMNGDSLFCSVGQGGQAVSGSTSLGGTIQLFDWVTLSEPGAIEIWCERGPLSTSIQNVVARRIAAVEVTTG